MQYVTSASYPVKHFFRVCKDKWKYTESGQTAAHVTSYKNTDLKSSSLAASYLNCSTTFHLFKNVTDLQKSRTKTKPGNSKSNTPRYVHYIHSHTNNPPCLLLVKSKTGFHKPIHSFSFFTLMALHLPSHDCNICYCLKLCNSDISFRG